MTQTQSVPSQPAFGGWKALSGALVLGAIAAGLIVAFLASRDDSDTSAPASESVRVVVAREDIASGTTISRDMIEERSVPRELLLSGAFTELDAVEGEVARYPIPQGSQVATAGIVQATTSKSVSFQIPAGMRGFTVPVSVTNSPAALLSPGDFVDVLVSGELVRLGANPDEPAPTLGGESSEKPKVAVTLIQNVQVISVQREYVDNGVVYDSATRGNPVDEEDSVEYVMLALTPEQSQLLWLASQEGAVTLTLRPFGEEDPVELAPVAEPIPIGAAASAEAESE